MQKLTYRITTLAPLLLSTISGDPNMVAAKEYIPGTILLGLAAGRYIRKYIKNGKAHEDETFKQLFLQSKIIFSNAYIATYAENGKKLIANYPLPVSIRYEKDNENEIHDLLFEMGVEVPTKAIGSYGRLSFDGSKNSVEKQNVSKSLNFHHQRDPQTGSSKEGLIFNYEAIDPDQVFVGEISCDSENSKNLEKIKALFSGENIFYIGRSRNSQYGKIKFEWIEPAQIIHPCSDDSLARKNETGQTVMTMLAPAIIYNAHGFSEVSEENLKRHLSNIFKTGFEITKSFFRTTEIENFVSVWGLPRPSETVFAAGSCFLLSGIKEEDRKKLYEIQVKGIGERRAEGFGRVIFDWQNSEIQDYIKIDSISPPQSILIAASKILKTIIKREIEKAIEEMALLEADEFTPKKADRFSRELPSKSLISRIEAMSQNMEENKFVDTIKDGLMDTAKRKLEKCLNNKENLIEFISKNKNLLSRKISEIKIEKDRKTVTPKLELKNLLEDEKTGIDFKQELELNPEFQKRMFKKYYQVFFAVMRRKKKSENELKGEAV